MKDESDKIAQDKDIRIAQMDSETEKTIAWLEFWQNITSIAILAVVILVVFA